MISDGEESDEPFLDELFRGGESDEELEEDTSTAALKAKWKDVPPSTTASFKVNSGRKLGMDRGCAEVKFVQSRIQELFKKSLRRITKKDIINLFFGDSGMLTTVLKDMLPNKDVHSAYKFLATFCLQNIVSKDCSTIYDILTVLAATCTKYGAKRVSTANTEKTIITRLLDYDKNIETSNELPPDESDDEVKRRGIRQLLERSFQTRFTGAKRAACDVGHKMEPKLAQNFIKDINGGKLDSACNLKRVLGAYTTGLAGKRSCLHVKDSIDLILVVEVGMDDGSTAREVWGCEMKTRVARNTMVEEIAFQRKKHGPDATEDSVYTTCHHNFLHDQVHKLSERCQLLHHAYVYNLDRIVYLVGDNMGEILHGNIITFEEEILTSYGKVLQDTYGITLSWAYEEGEEEND